MSSFPKHVGEYYRVERLLGVGGLSKVFEVVDERDCRRLALKQLAPSNQTANLGPLRALFRQEFHILTQIAHPNVVSVDDYGFDSDQPFYTMELVAGQALDVLAPLDWKQLGRTLLDLCFPLSLLHARRFVHSDITARNVLVSDRGVTKLIDFGALTPIDEPTTTIAGTPSYMAPELVDRQMLDGRVDIFALGALAYFVLSGRHAYPARTIRELYGAWQVSPPSLTELGVDLPLALDRLIMAMLSLDRAARPVQIAELVQRLCAITGDSAHERGAIDAHAATPKLVAREALIESFRSLHEKATQAAGELMCIAGAKGMGRSRALDACALEARLNGSLVLRVSCAQTARVDFGVYASLLGSALQKEPELAALLGLAAGAELERELLRFSARADSRTQLDAFWGALTADRVVVLLVDDLPQADLPSVQQLLLLAESSARRRLLIVASMGSGQTALERDLKQLFEVGRLLELRPLSAAETEQLLRSMFGDTSQLEALAAWVHGAAAGVPKACVELAHYAVQRGVVCYRDGQFQVDGDLARLELPGAYDDAILARVRALSDAAREVLGALSLLTPFGALSTLEHLELLGHSGRSRAEALAVLDELRDAQLLKPRAEGYELHSEAVRRLATAELGAAGARLWHERIGSYYQSCGHARAMLAALHLEYAGERQRAYEQLLPLDARIQGMDDPNIPLGGSALGIALHQAMREHAVALGRRPDEVHFRRILLELAATSNPSVGADGMDLLRRLRIDAGLDLWNGVDPALDEPQKLLYCLARGQERYLATPEAERSVPVRDAVKLLAQCASVLASLCALTFDRATMAELFHIFEPLRTLSPVLTLTYRQLENSAIGLTQGGRMTARWNQLLQALETPPEGMRELIWRYVVSNLRCHIGREAATFGEEAYRPYAEELGRHRRRQRQGLSLDLLYSLAHGRFEESKRLRRELEIATVASNHEDQLVVFAYIAELELLEACGDLLELQRLSSWFDARASRYPGWKPFAAIARAACLVLCDRPDAAEAVLAEQLEAAPVLEHAAWYWLRALRAEASLLAGNLTVARQQAEELLQLAAAAKLDMHGHTRPQRVLALANVALGDEAAARSILDPLLSEYETSTTVRAGQLFEASARVALFCEDEAGYARCLSRVRDIYAPGAYPGLLARLERLAAAGRRAFDFDAAAPSTDAFTVQTVQSASLLEGNARGHSGHSLQERVPYLLSLLIADGRASAGKLYSVTIDGSVTLVHTESAPLNDAAQDGSVADYVAHLTSLEADTTRVETLQSPYDGIRRLDDACALVPLRDYHGTLRGVALLRTEAGTARLVCSPALCSMVADALAALAD